MNKRIRILAAAVAVMMALSLAGCKGGITSAQGAKNSDTVQWFNNTYAILTTANGQDVTLVGGMKPGLTAKASAMVSLEDDGKGATGRYLQRRCSIWRSWKSPRCPMRRFWR